MTTEETDAPASNPIDTIEEMISQRDWDFDRSSDNELDAHIAGRWANHHLYFLWQPDMGALQFSCQFDMKIDDPAPLSLIELLVDINQRMWAGHFEIDDETRSPSFRYTLLARGQRVIQPEQIEDIVEIGVAECERFFPAFQFVLRDGKSAAVATESAILDTLGEA